MRRSWVLVVAVLLAVFGLTLPHRGSAQASASMSVTPNPASSSSAITVQNSPGATSQCSPPSRVNVQVTSGADVVQELTVEPDGSGNWSHEFAAGSLAPGTYVVAATCGSPSTCPTGGAPTTAPCQQCTVGGSAPFCNVCDDGTTAGSCTPCDDGGTTVGACVPCDDGSTVIPGGSCPPTDTTPTTAAPVAEAAAVAQAPAAPEAVGPFDYESVTLTVTAGVVSGSPASTG